MRPVYNSKKQKRKMTLGSISQFILKYTASLVISILLIPIIITAAMSRYIAQKREQLILVKRQKRFLEKQKQHQEKKAKKRAPDNAEGNNIRPSRNTYSDGHLR